MSATTFSLDRTWVRASVSPACANCGDDRAHLDRNGLCPTCAQGGDDLEVVGTPLR